MPSTADDYSSSAIARSRLSSSTIRNLSENTAARITTNVGAVNNSAIGKAILTAIPVMTAVKKGTVAKRNCDSEPISISTNLLTGGVAFP